MRIHRREDALGVRRFGVRQISLSRACSRAAPPDARGRSTARATLSIGLGAPKSAPVSTSNDDRFGVSLLSAADDGCGRPAVAASKAHVAEHVSAAQGNLPDMLRTALVLSLMASMGCAAQGSYRRFGGPFDGDGDPLSTVTGKLFDDYSLFTSPARVKRVALSRDGRFVAARQTNVKLWDVERGRAIGSLEHDGSRAEWIGFDDRRDLFGILRARRLEVRDPIRMKLVTEVELPEGDWFASAACLHDGEAWIAFRAYGDTKVRLRHAPSMASWEVEAEGYDISFSPSCDAVVVHTFERFTFIGLTEPTLDIRRFRWEIEDKRGALAATAVNRFEVWAAGHSELKQFEMARGAVRSLPSPDRSGGYPWDPPLVASHDGRLLALVTEVFGGMNASPATVHLLERETGRSCAKLTGHGDSVHGLAFSADGRFLATGSRDQTVRVWRVPPACSPNAAGGGLGNDIPGR